MNRRTKGGGSRQLGLLVLSLLLFASPAGGSPPPEGSCPRADGSPAGDGPRDAGPPLLREGSVLGLADMLRLRSLLPAEVWSHREAFFYEGMRLEIGSCHRRYATPDFYADATRRLADRSKLDDAGNLRGYVAGLPFPPESIDPQAATAATRWAWNLQYRYRGAGPVGSFRLLDLPSRIGKPETYQGHFFFVQTGHRADLPGSDYRVRESRKSLWVAGGRFEEPFNARHLAWRQIRGVKSERKFKQPDDTFVYVPTMRKPRRAATTWTDGVYTPRYTVSGDSGGGGVPYAIGAGGDGSIPTFESIHPTAGLSIAATENMRRGFTGLALRPNAWKWSFVGEKEVLAPLNASTPGWPENPDRNYGPSGLSVASDRWDVRWAVVIEGTGRRPDDEVGRIQLWIDYQTQQPLYYISRRPDGGLLDIGILVHRYSSDLVSYPAWPGGEPARVFDPVAASFYFVPGGGSGWRRESYDLRSLPVDPKTLRRFTSTDYLLRGH